MKVKVLVGSALLAASACTQAASFGLGVTLEGNDNAIYLPIDLDNNLILEPYIRLIKNDEKEGEERWKYEYNELGLGLFGKNKRENGLFFYYGARIGYVEGESSSDWRDQEYSGYKVAPTIGIGYEVVPGLTVSGEAEWFYRKMDGDIRYSYDEMDIDFDETLKGTESRLVIRYQF